MKTLLHICCAPCSIYPVGVLRNEGFGVWGYFYRDNIHPYSECKKRQETLLSYAKGVDLGVIVQKGYDLERFIRNVAFRESDRCLYCYHDRMEATAKVAVHGKFDFFSTTLLYSRFQRHDDIRAVGESVGRSIGIPFLYRDFRAGWKAGIEASKALGMYRQQYCGCIYSEKERFYRA